MITREMIKNGFENDKIEIKDKSDWCNGICCVIGNESFYFLYEDLEQSLEEFWNTHTLDMVVDMLYDILKDAESAEDNGIDSDELQYYEGILSPSKIFKVDITETYKRTILIEAGSEDEAYDIVDEKINNGDIDLPCDGDGYDYSRDLFVSKTVSQKGSED